MKIIFSFGCNNNNYDGNVDDNYEKITKNQTNITSFGPTITNFRDYCLVENRYKKFGQCPKEIFYGRCSLREKRDYVRKIPKQRWKSVDLLSLTNRVQRVPATRIEVGIFVLLEPYSIFF